MPICCEIMITKKTNIFFFFKKCSNDDPFISCNDRIGKMLHNICISAVAISFRWASCGSWASCLYLVSLKNGAWHFNTTASFIFWEIQTVDINSHTEWQNVQISYHLQKPTDLDLHCLQKRGSAGPVLHKCTLPILPIKGVYFSPLLTLSCMHM